MMNLLLFFLLPFSSSFVVPSVSPSISKAFILRPVSEFSSTSSSRLYSDPGWGGDNNSNANNNVNSPDAGLSSMVSGAGVSNAGEPPFEIRGFSLGNAVLFGGLGVTCASFVDYLGSAGGDGLSVSGLGFVYGIPIALAGCALKYAEIEPVESVVYNGAEGLFDAKATE